MSATNENTTKNKWIPVGKELPKDGVKVEAWIYIYASPRSFGMSSADREPNCWRRDGKWVHEYKGEVTEIFSDYVTHWSPYPAPENPPKAPKVDLW
jgi:hypothetical protein